MCTECRLSADELGKGRTQLHIDVANRRAGLLHSAELRGPGNVSRSGEGFFQPPHPTKPAVIDDKLNIRKILRGLDEIPRMIVILDRSQRQALMHADTRDTELP